MPKSKSRNKKKCKNCLLCDKVGDIHKYNDISTLLANVTKWDIEDNNQYKQINNYECLICNFKTSTFNDWKCHIMSISHLSDSHKMEENIYSYICCNKNCKVVLYGSEKSLLEHNGTHENLTNQEAIRQNNTVNLSGIPNLMVEVLKRFGTEQNPLYFCSHCKQIANKSIHAESEIITSLKKPITHYCKFCRVELFSSPEWIDIHSLSVEHLTLKCFDVLSTMIKANSKKKKLSESKFAQPNPSNEKDLQPVVLNVCTNNLVKLPMIVLNRFEKMNPYKGDCELCKLIKCKLCNISLCWDAHKIISHLLICEYKCDLTGSNETSIKTFECNVCDYSTDIVYDHKMHMISYLHLTNCHDIHNLYSYFCKVCNTFMYSHITAIKIHLKLHIKNNIITEMPILSTFMANVLKDFNINPNRINFIHYYGNTESNKLSKVVSIKCFCCKIEFHTSVDDYNMHRVTTEHIILKFLSPKMYVLKENNLATTISKPAVNKQIQDVSLIQNSDRIQVIENKHLKTGQVNKSHTNLDKNYSEPLDVVQNDQKIIKNNVFVKELENDLNQTSINELITNYKKQHYTKYFNHKIKILNVLCQYKDRIIKTLSYYCGVCDFITEEKYSWDNHKQMEHQESPVSEIYCSSCSMLIVGSNIKEHNNTLEHSYILHLLNSLELIENNLEKNTALVKTNTLDEFPCTYLNKNEELKSKNKISAEMLEFQCIDKNGLKFNGLLCKDKDDNNKNSKELLKLPSVNDGDQNYEQSDDVYDVRNNVLEDNQSKEKISHFVDKFSPLQNVTNLYEQVNTVELHEDDAYGKYVTQRLQLIENNTVKQDIKLEIDHLFYVKIKQLSLK